MNAKEEARKREREGWNQEWNRWQVKLNSDAELLKEVQWLREATEKMKWRHSVE